VARTGSLSARKDRLNTALLRDYYCLFGREKELDELLRRHRTAVGSICEASGCSDRGGDVADQTRLRPRTPVRDLDELLRFLAWIEATFGPVKRRARPIVGDRFLL
jgi:hypothetical protein